MPSARTSPFATRNAAEPRSVNPANITPASKPVNMTGSTLKRSSPTMAVNKPVTGNRDAFKQERKEEPKPGPVKVGFSGLLKGLGKKKEENR
jgi:hypothetical protein